MRSADRPDAFIAAPEVCWPFGLLMFFFFGGGVRGLGLWLLGLGVLWAQRLFLGNHIPFYPRLNPRGYEKCCLYFWSIELSALRHWAVGVLRCRAVRLHIVWLRKCSGLLARLGWGQDAGCRTPTRSPEPLYTLNPEPETLNL